MAGQGGIQASSNSLQALAGRESGDRPAQPSMWRSLVATPMKALKASVPAWLLHLWHVSINSDAWHFSSA